MNIYEKMRLSPVRTIPDVWISRLVIYEDTSAKSANFIRDIPLTRGLNIIWAEEAEIDLDKGEITGHSAGKTTLCRFIRYVLGERTFGTRPVMELMRKSFPMGYVAAELYVVGTKWAVRRPIGTGRVSYIKQGATIEELLADRVNGVSQEDYPQKLGLDKLLDRLETSKVVKTGETIEWDHILAWCTRDQEARFQNIYDWRSPRSGAETPAFRYSKTGPLFVMRAVLGLFLPEELKREEALSLLYQEQDRLEKDIEEKKREPQFRVNLYDSDLRGRLKVIFPDDTNIDFCPVQSGDLLNSDLERLTKKGEEKLAQEIKAVSEECAELQEKIDAVGGEISRLEQELITKDAVLGLTNKATHELSGDVDKREKERQTLATVEAKGIIDCPLAGIPLDDCCYLQDRKNTLKFTDIQDAHAREQYEAKRTEEISKVEEENKKIEVVVEQLKKDRSALLERRKNLLKLQPRKETDKKDLITAFKDLNDWAMKRDKLGSYKQLDDLRTELDGVFWKIEQQEKILDEILKQHDSKRRLLASIFSGAVHSVLPSGSYNGEVDMANRELSFRITHGPAMSGEAVETLSVLLADIAALIYNTISKDSHLPGFLLHDSPREADLGLGIYHNFLRFAASLQEHFGSADNSPFQYILTTTTPPPKEILNNPSLMKLTLNASVPSELLLRRSIATITNPSPAQPELF